MVSGALVSIFGLRNVAVDCWPMSLSMISWICTTLSGLTERTKSAASPRGAIEGTLSDDEVHALARAIVLLERVTATITGNTSPPGPEPAPITGDW